MSTIACELNEVAAASEDHLNEAPLRILVVEDHCVVREGISLRIDAEPGMKVIAAVATGEEAIAAVQRLRPAVIIMDLVLPALNGIDATRHILRISPSSRIVALSACHSLEQVHRTLSAGAHAYVLKSAGGNELAQAITNVAAGQIYISMELIALYGEQALQTMPLTNPIERLSERERQVLQCLIAGLTSAETATKLILSCKTIETYRCRLMLKLGVTNRAALIQLNTNYELPNA